MTIHAGYTGLRSVAQRWLIRVGLAVCIAPVTAGATIGFYSLGQLPSPPAQPENIYLTGTYCETIARMMPTPFLGGLNNNAELAAFAKRHRQAVEFGVKDSDAKSAMPFTCTIANGFDWRNTGGNWKYANFSGAQLEGARFGSENGGSSQAELDYSGADFSGANLKRALFYDVNLKDAKFRVARLDGTNLSRSDISGADFTGASVAGLIFEPRFGAGSHSLRLAVGLEYMRYIQDADGLLQFRESLRRAGRRDLERKVTYAIESTKTAALWQQGERIAAIARYVGWQMPTQYDLRPEQALAILAVSVLLFAGPYYAALTSNCDPKIWLVLPRDRLGGDGVERVQWVTASGLHRAWYALQFSMYSAFQLGWRDLNVGNWLSRLQRREYFLRGSGWVRSLSGMQSLLSVYLLAMWALTQFGRLFEG